MGASPLAATAPRAGARPRATLWLNVIGGLAVLGSYVWAVGTRADAGPVLWGAVPESFRSLYTTNMLLAAAGYFPFSYLLVLRGGADAARARERIGGPTLFALYFLVLIPSALWAPLTFAYADAPSSAAWLVVRADLALAGLGSLGLLACVATLRPRPAGWLHALGVVGALAFCFQTVVLDALIWPAYYHAP